MLSCVDMYKTQYVVSLDLGILNYTQTPKLTGTTYMVTPKQMAQHKLLMKWLCKMANSVLRVNGELLEYHHLIANQTTRATWQHSYGNWIADSPRECWDVTPAPTPSFSSRKNRSQTKQSEGLDLRPHHLPHKT